MHFYAVLSGACSKISSSVVVKLYCSICKEKFETERIRGRINCKEMPEKIIGFNHAWRNLLFLRIGASFLGPILESICEIDRCYVHSVWCSIFSFFLCSVVDEEYHHSVVFLESHTVKSSSHAAITFNVFVLIEALMPLI